jgi:two-component system LytT family sensor kinase
MRLQTENHDRALKRNQRFTQILLGRPIYWFCQALFWVGLWFLFWIMTAADDHRPFDRLFLLDQTFLCLFGLLFTHLFRCNYYLRGWSRLLWPALIPRVLICSALFAMIGSILGRRIVAIIVGFPSEMHRFPIGPFLMSFTQSGSTLLAWSAIYLGYQYQRQLQFARIERLELNSAIKDAQLMALRHQVNPHFLFNCLNTIRALIDENREKAREAITKLSELFRASLQTSEHKVILLRDEMRTVEAYLTLEKLRFEERLAVEMEIDSTALDALVPPFLVQILVENALKHGDYVKGTTRMLECQIQTIDETIRIRISNPGTFDSAATANGTGLANARQRLKLLYADDASLKIYSAAQNKVTAELNLPRLWQLS